MNEAGLVCPRGNAALFYVQRSAFSPAPVSWLLRTRACPVTHFTGARLKVHLTGSYPSAIRTPSRKLGPKCCLIETALCPREPSASQVPCSRA